MLLVRHGKCCKRCAANGKPRQQPVGPCPLAAATGSPTKGAAERAVKLETSAEVKSEPVEEARADSPEGAKRKVKAEPARKIKFEPAPEPVASGS